MNIIVNGRPIEVTISDISYEEVVSFANKTGNPTVVYSSPRKGDSRRSGEMHTGCPRVLLEDGMIFTAMHTGNA